MLARWPAGIVRTGVDVGVIYPPVKCVAARLRPQRRRQPMSVGPSHPHNMLVDRPIIGSR